MRTKYLLVGATASLVAAVAMAAPGSDRFAKLDADGNGSVTRAEIDARTADRFAKLDGDRDGFVTKAEMTAHHEAMKAKRAERAAKHGGDNAKHAEHRAERAGERGDYFARRDADNDGRLSLAEFQAGGAKRFERLDSDKNGTVTRDEMAKARETWKARPQG
jgi:EF hand